MSWLTQLLFDPTSVSHTVFAISLVGFVGLLLGRIRVYGVGLGIGAVLFAGIAISALGIAVDHAVLEFLRDFGLVVFVYMIGLQVGPGFVSSLKSDGRRYVALASVVVLLGTIIVGLLVYFKIVPLAVGAGILSGATTNTPSLGAAQEALHSVGLSKQAADASLGYAVAYPIGVIGTIAVIALSRFLFGTTPEAAAQAYLAQSKKDHEPLKRQTFIIENENLIGLSPDDIPGVGALKLVISRVFHEGQTSVPSSETKLTKGDALLAVGSEDALRQLGLIVGSVAPIDLAKEPSCLSDRRILVTNKAVVGQTLDELNLTELHPVQITRIRRGDVDFTATGEMTLQLGDTVRVVGEEAALHRFSKTLGNAPRELEHFQFFPIFIGICIGVLIGSKPWEIPGMPAALKLGLAGGPLITALFMSRYTNGKWFNTYVPYGANIALREFGIIMFLASVGLKAGEQFFSVLFSAQGFEWLICGAAVTLIPLIILSLGSRVFKGMNYLSFSGLCAGSMTDPPALAFAGSLAKQSNASAIAYATVYPFVMLLRIICAQLLVLVVSQLI